MKVLSYIISPEFVYMWIRVATPIIFSSLGGVICSRAGVVNLGLEGIMLISALAGVLGSAFGGSLLWGMWLVWAAALAVSALFAYFHLVLKANNVLCGTAVNTMASGLTVFVLQLATGEKGNSSSLKSFCFSAGKHSGDQRYPGAGQHYFRTQRADLLRPAYGVCDLVFPV